MSKVLITEECGPYQCRANDLATQRDAFKSDAAALQVRLDEANAKLAEQEKRIVGLVGALTTAERFLAHRVNGDFFGSLNGIEAEGYTLAQVRAALAAQPPAPGATDGERLDWLEKHGSEIDRPVEHETDVKHTGLCWYPDPFEDKELFIQGENLRAAIDAALRAERGGK